MSSCQRAPVRLSYVVEIPPLLLMLHLRLKGMLAADLIGFQTANFARHFRQTVSRILSLEAVPKGITSKEGKFTDVGVFPMGIDVRSLTMKRRDPEVAEWVALLRKRYEGLKLIVGRDKLDEVQGVKQKLQAFEEFLITHPEFCGQVSKMCSGMFLICGAEPAFRLFLSKFLCPPRKKTKHKAV